MAPVDSKIGITQCHKRIIILYGREIKLIRKISRDKVFFKSYLVKITTTLLTNLFTYDSCGCVEM